MLKLFGAGQPDHPLADPKEARRVIGDLPANDPLKALEELAHWHESVGAAPGFRADARIELLFLIDEAAQPRMRKLAREYVAATRPSRVQENRMWTHAYDYCRQSAHAYALAVDAVLQGAKGADAAKAQLPLLAVRALRAVAQQIKWLHLRYGPIDPAMWRVLSGIFAFAEARGIADTAVAAAYPGVAGETSPRQEFLRALVLGVSSPDSLMPPEVDFTERLIGELAPQFVLRAQPGADATHWTDLGLGMPPQRLAKPPQPAPGLRYFGAGPALDALGKLIARIEQTAQLPPALAAGAIADREGAVDVLRHIQLYWSPVAPERKHPRHSVKSRLSIVHGLDAVVAVLSGAQSLDFNQPAENWIVENVSAGGFGAVVPQAKGDWLKIGALLAMQPDGGNNWIIGMIRRVSKSGPQEARVGIQTLSRAPELARFAVRGEEIQGVLLPAPGLGSGEASIALRAGAYAGGQNLECERGGKSYVYLSQGLAEHGDDYDIVRFREMLRESGAE